MALMKLKALSVPESLWSGPWVPQRIAPHSTASDIPAGSPAILNADGLFEVAALSSSYVTDANALYGVTNEPFRSALAAVGSVPVRQVDVGIGVLLPGVPIIGNYYYDGDDDSDDAISATLRGESLALLKLSSGVYVFTTAGGGHALFQVVGFIDKVGDIYGRIACVPIVGDRLFA